MQTISRAAVALSVLAAGIAAQDLTVKWDKGLKIRSEDKKFDFRIGGRVHYDWAFIGNDSTLGVSAADGAEFRRARLYLQGTLWGNVELKTQYDFEDGVADFKDVYVGLKGLPGNGKVRVGQYKEPMSLEELTSSNNITLMERSAMNGLIASRQGGISWRAAVGESKKEHLTYQVGVFRPTNSTLGGAGNAGDSNATNEYNLSARVTGTPVFEKGGQIVHVGAAVSVREYNQDNLNGATGVRYRSNREIHLGNRLLSTGTLADADSAFVYNVEAAFVEGPFSAQAEYTVIDIDSMTAMDPSIHGHYVQVAYTITGESRSYKNYDGVFGGITPDKPYGADDGFGAVEVAFRYTGLDFSDIPGFGAGGADGELTGYTLGANWYLNANTRVMANYVLNEAGGSGAGTGEENAFMVRFQVHF